MNFIIEITIQFAQVLRVSRSAQLFRVLVSALVWVWLRFRGRTRLSAILRIFSSSNFIAGSICDVMERPNTAVRAPTTPLLSSYGPYGCQKLSGHDDHVSLDHVIIENLLITESQISCVCADSYFSFP